MFRPTLLAAGLVVTALVGVVPAAAAKPSSGPADYSRGGNAMQSSYDGTRTISTDFSLNTSVSTVDGTATSSDGIYFNHHEESCDATKTCTSEDLYVYGEDVTAAVQGRIRIPADLSSARLRPTRVPAIRMTQVCYDYQYCVSGPEERTTTLLSATMTAIGPEQSYTYDDQFLGRETVRYRPATATVSVLGRTFDQWTETTIRETVKG